MVNQVHHTVGQEKFPISRKHKAYPRQSFPILLEFFWKVEEAVTGYLEFFTMESALYPAKAQEELDFVVGKDGLPSCDDI